METKIERFEDILVWKKSRELVMLIYHVTSENEGFKRDFDLKSQIRRAAISVMSNIAEGFARRSDKAFANFLHIAHGSIAEVQSQLYVALDLDYISKAAFDKTYEMSDEISRQSQNFIKYLNNSQSSRIL
ncbi:MAG: four helix bundle protein [Elusimicrobia bacterium]|nr:four helix bundle protein [Elusimicrobiota bacterium]